MYKLYGNLLLNYIFKIMNNNDLTLSSIAETDEEDCGFQIINEINNYDPDNWYNFKLHLIILKKNVSDSISNLLENLKIK